MISWGPFGLLFLSALDSVGVPLVGGVDLLLITFSSINHSEAYWAALCAILGSIAGSAVLFGIARTGGEKLLAKHTSKSHGARLRRWFESYGLLTVFIPAISPIPMPMKIPVFCAGALEVRWSFFLAVVAAARVLRYLTLAYLGTRYGSGAVLFIKSHWQIILGVTVALAAAAFVFIRVAQRHSHTPA
ncbi:MAG TPA: VTT domain-containing protein [Bryobacteraceae bacterium]|nr:VTT domain-containing protein [Bryobacteraceae bacterium]